MPKSKEEQMALPQAKDPGFAQISATDISWKLTSSYIQGDSPTPNDFTAVHGRQVIGRIHQIPSGPARGLWAWALTVEDTPDSSGEPPSGRASERAEAGRRLLIAYESFLQGLR